MSSRSEHSAARPSHGVRVAIQGARRVFSGDVVAIDAIDLDVPAGQFVAILGPSGCGKSTLLRLVAGLDRPDAGTVTVQGGENGDLVAQPSVACVFQDANLLPWRSVRSNVTLPLELAGVRHTERLAAAHAAIQQVGLGDAAQRYPAELSGGMRMRVSLARAVVTRPKLLLLDEPFAALDELTRYRLDDELRKLWAEHRMTVLFVTHSITEAVYLAERAVVLSSRPARVIADGPIDLAIERCEAIRAEAAFAQQVRKIQLALEAASDGRSTL